MAIWKAMNLSWLASYDTNLVNMSEMHAHYILPVAPWRRDIFPQLRKATIEIEKSYSTIQNKSDNLIHQ
jgi:hypothetical protein